RGFPRKSQLFSKPADQSRRSLSDAPRWDISGLSGLTSMRFPIVPSRDCGCFAFPGGGGHHWEFEGVGGESDTSFHSATVQRVRSSWSAARRREGGNYV